MYTVTHLAEHAVRPPHPDPVPRPGDPEPPGPAGAYDFSDVPAIPISELGSWLST